MIKLNTNSLATEQLQKNINFKDHLTVAKGVFKQQWIISKSYIANTLIYIIIPFVLSLFPILLFRALNVNQESVTANFFGGVESEHLNGFIVLGVNLWMLILIFLWDFSTYLRDEQYAGTLETLLMSPAKRYSILTGRAAFSILFNIIVMFSSTVLSLLILDRGLLFSQQFLHLLAVIGVVLIGTIPMIGISYLIGGLVLRFKEIYSLVNTLQWVFGVIMGIYAPFTTLPLAIRIMGFLFPGTWSVTDIRALTTGSPPMLSLLGIKSLNLPILWDTIIVVAFGLLWCLFGYLLFSKIEFRIKRKEGLSKY